MLSTILINNNKNWLSFIKSKQILIYSFSKKLFNKKRIWSYNYLYRRHNLNIIYPLKEEITNYIYDNNYVRKMNNEYKGYIKNKCTQHGNIINKDISLNRKYNKISKKIKNIISDKLHQSDDVITYIKKCKSIEDEYKKNDIEKKNKKLLSKDNTWSKKKNNKWNNNKNNTLFMKKNNKWNNRWNNNKSNKWFNNNNKNNNKDNKKWFNKKNNKVIINK